MRHEGGSGAVTPKPWHLGMLAETFNFIKEFGPQQKLEETSLWFHSRVLAGLMAG